MLERAPDSNHVGAIFQAEFMVLMLEGFVLEVVG